MVLQLLEEALALKEDVLATTCMGLIEMEAEEVLGNSGFDATVHTHTSQHPPPSTQHPPSQHPSSTHIYMCVGSA